MNTDIEGVTRDFPDDENPNNSENTEDKLPHTLLHDFS